MQNRNPHLVLRENPRNYTNKLMYNLIYSFIYRQEMTNRHLIQHLVQIKPSIDNKRPQYY